MLNTYGLKMKGIKRTSGETYDYYNDGCYNEIFYDLNTGEVWACFHCSLGMNSWTEYHDNDIIHVCNTTHHLTMQELADKINKSVAEHKAIQLWYAEEQKKERAWEAEIEQQYQEEVSQ